ncbi:MAG: tripartite tricarboxylate transporter TctB family protein [Salinicola sp.]|nr:tripartite tricarboxylate transporter TctB family protein [Salinicola sp.]
MVAEARDDVIRKKTDCQLALFLMLFCAFAAWRTTLIPASGTGTRAGPDFFPWLAIIGIAVLALALLLRGLRTSPRPKPEAGAGRIGYGVLSLFAVLMVAYAATFERVGYLPSTIVMYVIGMLLLKERRVVHFLLVPVAVVLGVYFGFTGLLDVYLP